MKYNALIPPQQLSLILPIDDPNLPWLGTLVGVPVLGFYFWCTNQFIVQRVLGARSIAHARWGALFAAALKLSVLFLMVLPGVMASAIMPGLENGDQVFPAMVGRILPPGLVGLVIAALIAALMSSIDSTLNSAAALITLDFIKPLWKSLTARQMIWVGRLAIMFFMVISSLMAPLIGRFEGLFHYLQTALAFLVPPVTVIFILGIFWPRAGARAAMVTLILGHLVSALVFIATVSGWLNLHFTLIAGLLFVVSALIFWITGHLSPQPAAKQITPFTYRPKITEQVVTGPWWQDYRFYAMVIVGLTAWQVMAFW